MTWARFKAMMTPAEWRARFARNRWLLAWSGFAGLFLFMLVGCSAFWDRPWLGNFLSAFGTAIAVVLSVLIYAHGQAASAKATREQMDHMQALTQKQIAALAENTNRQIAEYAKETRQVVSKLSENSLLLGELLKRELEDAIGKINDREKHAVRDLNKAENWQPLAFRTPEQKAAEVAAKRSFLGRVRQLKSYFLRKYEKLSHMFIGNNLEP